MITADTDEPDLAPEPSAESLAMALAAAGLALPGQDLPGVLETAIFLHRSAALVEAFLDPAETCRDSR